MNKATLETLARHLDAYSEQDLDLILSQIHSTPTHHLSLGELILSGVSTVKGHSLVHAGQSISLSRSSQPLSLPTTSTKKKARFTHSKKTNTIVRIQTGGKEIGKLTQDSSTFISKLLDLHWVR